MFKTISGYKKIKDTVHITIIAWLPRTKSGDAKSDLDLVHLLYKLTVLYIHALSQFCIHIPMVK